MANVVPQEYQIYNKAGHLIAANVLVPAGGTVQDAQYIAGVPAEYVAASNPNQPTKKGKQ